MGLCRIYVKWHPQNILKKLKTHLYALRFMLSKIANISYTEKKTDSPLIKLLNIQCVAQCLDMTETRSLSLLDDFARPKGELGRYLRWHMLKVRLVGYDHHQEPQFVVSAGASDSKFARRDGDKLSVDFSVGSLGYDTKASQRDLALGLVTLAAFTNAMGPQPTTRNYGQKLS